MVLYRVMYVNNWLVDCERRFRHAHRRKAAGGRHDDRVGLIVDPRTARLQPVATSNKTIWELQ